MSFVFCMSHPVVLAEDVSFDIETVEIQADIQDNGDVHFQHVYTYDVDYMNGAWISIETDEHPMTEYRLGIVNEEGFKLYFEENMDEAPKSFSKLIEGDTYKFKIYYPAEDQIVKFFIEFDLEGIVTNYQDTAELNWKILGRGIEETLDVRSQVNLPGPVKEDEHFQVWGHGAPQGKIHPIKKDQEAYIDINVPNNPSKTFVEVYALFPTRLTKNNPNVIDQVVLKEKVDAENQRVIEDQAKLEKSQKLGTGSLIFFSLIAPIPLLLSAFKYHKVLKKVNPNPALVPEHVYQPPHDRKPAVVGAAFIHTLEQSNSLDLTVTLLDLARRGFLDMKEVNLGWWDGESVEIKRTNQDTDALEAFENKVLSFVTPLEGDQLILKEIGKMMEEDEDYKDRQIDLIESFKEDVTDQGKALREREGTPAKSIGIWMTLSFIATVFCFIAAVFSGAFWGTSHSWVWGVFAISAILTVLIFFYLLFKSLRSPILPYEVDKERREWQAFGRMLGDIGQMDMRQIASLPLWEEYLVYAVLFGHGKKVIKAMKENFSLEEFEQAHLPNVIYTTNGDFVNSFNESILDSVSSSSFGSSGYAGDNFGGGGGGFSSGSSGGGGGGGAGGF